jgi:hypothetical protein
MPCLQLHVGSDDTLIVQSVQTKGIQGRVDEEQAAPLLKTIASTRWPEPGRHTRPRNLVAAAHIAALELALEAAGAALRGRNCSGNT